MADWALVVVGFGGGVVASLLVVWYFEMATRPWLELGENPSPALGQSGEQPPHAFYHLLVKHRAAWRPFSSRRPAWSARAEIEVFPSESPTALTPQPIVARWPSQPEPVKTVFQDTQPVKQFDLAAVFVGRRADVHFHDSRAGEAKIDVAVKFEGHKDCCVFSNESYFYREWTKPEWVLGPGDHTMKVRVFYESGVAERAFKLHNTGTTRDSLRICQLQQQGIASRIAATLWLILASGSGYLAQRDREE